MRDDTRRPPDLPAPDALTLALIRELADGRTTGEAAATCNVSKATAWRRLEAQRRDWQVEHNIQLIVTAVRHGWI